MTDTYNLKDFTKTFPSSDIVIVAVDKKVERKLYATKEILGWYSLYFEGQFYGPLGDVSRRENANEIRVDCSYEVMLTILELLYGHARDVSKMWLLNKDHILMDLYEACDYFQMPFAVDCCKWRMREAGSLEMATSILCFMSSHEACIIDLHDELRTCVLELETDELEEFLSTDSCLPIFSKEDVSRFYKRLSGNYFPRSTSWEYWISSMPVDIARQYNNSPIDFTKPWEGSDIILLTCNSKGNLLYSNRAMLSVASPYFREKLSKMNKSNDVPKMTVEYEYWLVKNVLAVIHFAYDPEYLLKQTDLFLMYAMYSIAAENMLNVPKVQELCILNFKYIIRRSPLVSFHFELSYLMDIGKKYLFQRAPLTELLIWLKSSGPKTNYTYTVVDGGLRQVNFSRSSEPLLSIKDLSVLLTRLKDQLG